MKLPTLTQTISKEWSVSHPAALRDAAPSRPRASRSGSRHPARTASLPRTNLPRTIPHPSAPPSCP